MRFKTLHAGAVKAATPDGSATVVIATTGRDGPIDHDGDVVQPGAIGEQTVPILPAHDWTSIWLGKARTRESGNEVLADLKFNLAIPEAQSWHAALAFDLANPPATAEYSWGYDAAASRPGRVGDRAVRLLDRLKLHEISMVVRGASVGTRTVAVKGDGSELAELERIRASVQAQVQERELRDVYIKTQARALYERFRENCALVSHAPGDGVRFCYQSTSVVLATVKLAAMLANHCARELQIEAPAAIRFFRDAGKGSDAPVDGFTWHEPVDGFCDREKRVVWLRAALPVGRLLEVVAHEVRHLAADGDELAAAFYGRRFSGEWRHAS